MGVSQHLQQGKFFDTLFLVGSGITFYFCYCFTLLDKIQPGWGGRDYLYWGPLTKESRDAVGTSFICRLRAAGETEFIQTFLFERGAVIRTIGQRQKVASWGGMPKEKSGSWTACDSAWGIAILFWAILVVEEEAPAIPRYFQGCPIPQVDGRHVKCGK